MSDEAPAWVYNSVTKRWDAPTGFWVGPGNWLYYVKAGTPGGIQSVQIAYSPKAHAYTYQALSSDTAGKVLDELRTKGGVYLGSQASTAKAAYEKKYRPAGAAPASAPPSSLAPPPTPPPAPDMLTQTRQTAAQYAPYLIVGGGLLVASLILFWPKKGEA